MDDRAAVELWQLLIGLAAVSSGFWPVWRGRVTDGRRLTEWRRDVDAKIETLERQSLRLDIDEHIRWRAGVDSGLKAGLTYDEQHRVEHGTILEGIVEIKDALAGMDKRLGIIESHRG